MRHGYPPSPTCIQAPTRPQVLRVEMPSEVPGGDEGGGGLKATAPEGQRGACSRVMAQVPRGPRPTSAVPPSQSTQLSFRLLWHTPPRSCLELPTLLSFAASDIRRLPHQPGGQVSTPRKCATSAPPETVGSKEGRGSILGRATSGPNQNSSRTIQHPIEPVPQTINGRLEFVCKILNS